MTISHRQLLFLTTLTLLSACAVQSGTDTRDSSRSSADRANNVILFLGDGMGVSTVTAARIYAGQREGGSGEDYVLPFENFPNVALVKTYNTDSQVADSAGTMTAIMTGQKTRIGVISVNASVAQGDCPASLQGSLPTLLEEAENAGLSTGIVTTTRITHATPAATYAHSPNRNWEVDVAVPVEARDAGCRDIARQMIEFSHGDGIDVMLGGGRAVFTPAGQADPEHADAAGAREDGIDLIETWLAADTGRTYVWNAAQFQSLEAARGQVLGLFEPSHMRFEADRAGDPAGEPSLAEMTRFAISRLQKSGKAFFLMVEGGRIDHAHHAGNAHRALVDTVAFADAIAVAMELTDVADTLIMVTADHSHTLTIGGYPERGNPILGKVKSASGEEAADLEGRPFTTLSYANGPGYQASLPDLTDVDTTAPDYRQAAAIPLESESHAGEDVAAYARGPNADTLRGVVEQNRLYEVLRGALFD